MRSHFPGNREGCSVQGRLIDHLSVARTLDHQPGLFLGLAGFGPQLQVHSPLLSTPRPMVLNWDLHHQQKEYSFSLWLSLQKDDARKLMRAPPVLTLQLGEDSSPDLDPSLLCG